jgi:hypothetical protein
VLQCLCLGISCGFTTAKTFSLWQVEQAEVSGTILFPFFPYASLCPANMYVCPFSTLGGQ